MTLCIIDVKVGAYKKCPIYFMGINNKLIILLNHFVFFCSITYYRLGLENFFFQYYMLKTLIPILNSFTQNFSSTDEICHAFSIFIVFTCFCTSCHVNIRQEFSKVCHTTTTKKFSRVVYALNHVSINT